MSLASCIARSATQFPIDGAVVAVVSVKIVLVVVSVSLVVLLIGHCSTESMTVRGDRYVYSIPASYSRSPDVFWALAGIEGDPGPMTYLEVPPNECPELVGNLSGLRLLLFHDRRYGMDSLTNYANRVAEESVRAAKSGDLHRYAKRTTTETTDHYFTFDPTVVGITHVNKRDFYARIRMLEPLVIGDSSATTPSAGCKIHFLFDGILIHASAGGAVCEAPNLAKLRDVVERLMEEWQSKDVGPTDHR